MSTLTARFWVAAAVAAGVMLAAGAGLGWHLWHGPSADSAPRIEIPMKSGTGAIARRLKAGRVIRSEWLFRVYVMATRQAQRLKAGEYEFPVGATMAQVADQLVRGKVVSHAFTVPEGFTARQIAAKLQQNGLVSAESFLAVVHDSERIQAWRIPGPSLEGFLFPDTYDLAKGLSAEQIAKRMWTATTPRSARNLRPRPGSGASICCN